MTEPEFEPDPASEPEQASVAAEFLLALPEGWVGSPGDGAPEGLAYVARLIESEGQAPMEATMAVAFQTIEGSNEPRAMLGELVAAGRAGEVELVELSSGPAVRRVRPAEGRQYYLRVPGTDDQIAVLSFATGTPAEEERLGEVFEAMAHTFTWA